MVTIKEVNMISDKISRLYQLQLPLNIENFSHNEDQNELTIYFRPEDEITKTYDFSKELILFFTEDSEICKIIIKNCDHFIH